MLELRRRTVIAKSNNILPYEYERVDFIKMTKSLGIRLPIKHGYGKIIETLIKGTFRFGTSTTNDSSILVANGENGIWRIALPQWGNAVDGHREDVFYKVESCVYGNNSTGSYLKVNDSLLIKEERKYNYFSEQYIYIINSSRYNMYGMSCVFGETRIYDYLDTNKEKPLAHCIPCVRKEDSQVGVYDTISNSFYTILDGTISPYTI